MATKYVVRDTRSGEYLAEKFMRGVYFTNDISQAVKFKSEADAKAKAEKQTVRPAGGMVYDAVNFN